MKQERIPCKSKDKEESCMISGCKQGDGSLLIDTYLIYGMRAQEETKKVNYLQTP